MTIRTLFAAAAAAGLVVAPISAQAASRHPAPIANGEKIAENPWIPWVVALAVALAIILVVTDDNPSSP
jgi:hypothetical protein